MSFLWCHSILLLLSHGVTTSGLNLVCETASSTNTNCAARNVEVFNENEHLQIEFKDNRTRDDIDMLSIYIELANSGFTSIPADVFELLPNVKRFNIYYSKMKFLSSDKVVSAKHLEGVTLFRCEISEIQPNTFSGFENLTGLSLEWNLLTHIKRDTFAELVNLTILMLNNNRIRAIDDGAFDLPELTRLVISSNKLTTLSDSLFSSIHKLAALYVNDNELIKIGRSMYGLPTIRQIHLENNKVVDIDLVEFAKMPLYTLYLGNSGISLESQTTSDFENIYLESLFVEGQNATNSRDLNKLGVFKELKYLDLQSNLYTGLDLPSINIKSFLPKLEHIILQYPEVDCPIVEALHHKMREQGVTLYFDKRCFYRNCEKYFSC